MDLTGGTDIHHRSTIQRGQSPSGPWENNPKNPILFNGADLTNAVQDTGHGDIVQGTDGRWWGVALGVRPQGLNFSHIQLGRRLSLLVNFPSDSDELFCQGRETFLFPVTWEDGWPVFNSGLPLTEHIPDVLPDVSALIPYTNNFTSDALDDSFYFVRTPYKAFHSLTARQGYLRLFANSYAPGDRDSSALLLRKQTAYTETFETRLDDFKPTSNLTEAGVSVYYGDSLHNEIGVAGGDDGRYIVVRTVVLNQQVGPWALTTANATVISVCPCIMLERFHLIFTSFSQVRRCKLATTDANVRFMVLASPASYSLGYAEGDDSEFTFPATIDSSALSIAPAGYASCTKVCLRLLNLACRGFFFKGAAFGIYNTGNGKPSLVSADFKHWQQTPTAPCLNNGTSFH